MPFQSITSEQAPKPIGPYSAAVVVDGKFVYTAGQISIDPATNQFIDGDIRTQTHQTLRSIDALLKSAGSSMKSVFKTTVFIKDMNEFGEMNKVYAEYFSLPAPARSTIEVARLPKDAKVEIEVIALLEQ
ncbi:MAG: Rid family detoxifying hydrolase [bacterium]